MYMCVHVQHISMYIYELLKCYYKVSVLSQHPFSAHPTSLPCPRPAYFKTDWNGKLSRAIQPLLALQTSRFALTSPRSTSRTCVDGWPLVHSTDSLDSGSAVLVVLETWFLWVTKGDVSPSDLLLAIASTLTSFSSCSLSFFSFSFR